MSLREFARAAGTSASRLSAYEHAKVAPRPMCWRA
jgi:transcriptional regulator with XRE-family HTH domain